MNNIKEKIKLLEKQLEGAKKIKDWAFTIDESNIDEDILLLEDIIKDYENIELSSLENSIRMIKKHCEKQEGVKCCEECPLGTKNGDCLLTSSVPDDWNINDTSKILI